MPSWFGLGGGRNANDPEIAAARAAAEARSAAWEQALNRHDLPSFVRERLEEAAQGKTPWLSTMTPAELLLAKTHGVKPLATVSGTCWFQYGYSWTEGHASGWRAALERIKAEARACGANAVVDVRMRTVFPGGLENSMDFTLVGTAVRIGSLPASKDPVIATVPALEFVRLLEAGIVPVGIGVGARYEWISDYNKSFSGNVWNGNQALGTLSNFWEMIRRDAHAELRRDTARQGTGVLAHIHFGQLLKQEGGDNSADSYLGRHIVIGTVVQARRGDRLPHTIETVVDMRDDLSPLNRSGDSRRTPYGTRDEEEAI